MFLPFYFDSNAFSGVISNQEHLDLLIDGLARDRNLENAKTFVLDAPAGIPYQMGFIQLLRFGRNLEYVDKPTLREHLKHCGITYE